MGVWGWEGRVLTGFRFQPQTLMKQIAKVMESNQVVHQATGPYTVRCERMNMVFEFEVARLSTVDSLHVVRARPVRADTTMYRDVARRLMAQLRL